LAIASNGDLLVGGVFVQAGGLLANRVARWNGAAWSTLASGVSAGTQTFVVALAQLPNGDVVAGGQFAAASGTAAQSIARWDGVAWRAIQPPGTGAGNAVTSLVNGDVIVGGDFTQLGGSAVNRIGRWNGSAWAALGSGCDDDVLALATMQNGDVVAGGEFLTAGGIAAPHIARWNGTAWSSFGIGLAGRVRSVAVLANGDVVAAGDFPAIVARWSGTQWNGLLPAAPAGAAVTTLAASPVGDLFALGASLVAGATGPVWRWDGASWTPLPPTSASQLAVDTDGRPWVSGNTQVQRFDGAAWIALPTITGQIGAIGALQPLPGGQVLAAQNSTIPSVFTSRLMRWNGQAWSVEADCQQDIRALRLAANGDVLATGALTRIGTGVSFGLGRRRSSCPATVVPYGQGCSGVGGVAALSAQTLPWVGATFYSRATGLPANGFGIAVLGLAATAIPLSTFFLVASPGCTALVSSDLLSLAVPVAGAAQLALPVPNSAALVGGVVRQQVVPLAFAASGALVEATASQALALTLGSY
jgi:trimeric autotransporter adhesin